MPLVDMKVEDLLKYEGISPCPKDFDEYWDNALNELKSIDYNVEFIKKEFPSKIIDMYDLYYTGTKDARIHAKVAVPKNIDGKVPAILKFHGLGWRSSDWNEMIVDASQGYVIAFMDTRGQGGLSQDVGGVCGTTNSTPFIRGLDGNKNDLLMRDVYLDTVILAEIIMGLEYVDETRVGCFGVSQGGGLSIACAALVPEIKKCFAVYPYLSDYQRVWDMDLDKGAYEGLRYYFRKFDPTHTREEEIFTKLGYIDIQHMAKRIKADVTMATGLMDTICPPSTQFAMYNKLTCNKNVVIYPDYGHEDIIDIKDKIFDIMAEL